MDEYVVKRGINLVDDPEEDPFGLRYEAGDGPYPAETFGDHFEALLEMGAIGEAVEATEAASALAAESGVTLTRVEGTGAGGRILKEDVERFLEEGDHGEA